MKKKHSWLVMAAALLVAAVTVSVLVLTRGKSQAHTSEERSLEHFLSMVPAEAFQWDNLSFADYQGIRSPTEITAGFYHLTSYYFNNEKISASMGFSPEDVGQSMAIGTVPFDQAWLKGKFATERVEEALKKQGYLPIMPEQEGLPLWGLEGNFSAGLQSNKEKRDMFFLFGGQTGQRWPVAFDEGVMVSSRDEQALRVSAAGKGPMLSEDPRMQTLLKALAQQPVKQLIVTQAVKVMPLLAEPLHLVAIAQTEERGKTVVLLGLEYADLSAAQAAEKRLNRSLPNAVLKISHRPLAEQLNEHGGKRMALRTVEGQDGKCWLVIPFQFTESGKTNPLQYGAPFRLFAQMMSRLDMDWLME